MSQEHPLFYDAYGKEIEYLQAEREEQLLAYKYVPKDSCGVLELGARYGTVSYAISNKVGHRPVVVSVDPDPTAWKAFEENVVRNNIRAFFVPGIISRKRKALIHLEYGSYTIDIEKAQEELERAQEMMDSDAAKGWITPYKVRLNTDFVCMTLEEVMEKTGISKFDTLVADCEGFLEEFLDENQILYESLKVILYEADGGGRSNYETIGKNLTHHGFRHEVNGFQNAWLKESV
jgi:FkbM family methyltransferase